MSQHNSSEVRKCVEALSADSNQMPCKTDATLRQPTCTDGRPTAGNLLGTANSHQLSNIQEHEPIAGAKQHVGNVDSRRTTRHRHRRIVPRLHVDARYVKPGRSE